MIRLMIEISLVFNWELWNGIPYDSQTKRSRCTFNICGWLNACIVCCQYGCYSVRNVYLASRPWLTYTHTCVSASTKISWYFPCLNYSPVEERKYIDLIQWLYIELDRRREKKDHVTKAVGIIGSFITLFVAM